MPVRGQQMSEAAKGGANGLRRAKGLRGARRPRRLRGVLSWLRREFAAFRSFWRDLTGESAYEKYVARHRREHPDCEPMSAREFWRVRSAAAEDGVTTGCC